MLAQRVDQRVVLVAKVVRGVAQQVLRGLLERAAEELDAGARHAVEEVARALLRRHAVRAPCVAREDEARAALHGHAVAAPQLPHRTAREIGVDEAVLLEPEQVVVIGTQVHFEPVLLRAHPLQPHANLELGVAAHLERAGSVTIGGPPHRLGEHAGARGNAVRADDEENPVDEPVVREGVQQLELLSIAATEDADKGGVDGRGQRCALYAADECRQRGRAQLGRVDLALLIDCQRLQGRKALLFFRTELALVLRAARVGKHIDQALHGARRVRDGLLTPIGAQCEHGVLAQQRRGVGEVLIPGQFFAELSQRAAVLAAGVVRERRGVE